MGVTHRGRRHAHGTDLAATHGLLNGSCYRNRLSAEAHHTDPNPNPAQANAHAQAAGAGAGGSARADADTSPGQGQGLPPNPNTAPGHVGHVGRDGVSGRVSRAGSGAASSNPGAHRYTGAARGGNDNGKGAKMLYRKMSASLSHVLAHAKQTDAKQESLLNFNTSYTKSSKKRGGASGEADRLMAQVAGVVRTRRYASQAAPFHPHGGQSDFVWLTARAPHVGPQYVWCLTARRNLF